MIYFFNRLAAKATSIDDNRRASLPSVFGIVAKATEVSMGNGEIGHG